MTLRQKAGFELMGGLLWGTPGSSGEDGDVVSTVAEIREKLATHPEAKVRLRVGTREFGEKVLRALEGNDDELGRVTVLLGGDHG